MCLEGGNIWAWSSRMRESQPVSPWESFPEQHKCQAWEHVLKRDNRHCRGCDCATRWFAALAKARSWGSCRPHRGGPKPQKSFKQEARAFLVAQKVKNLPVMQETRVRSLGQKDPLEKGMAMHSSILAWRNPWTEEPGGLWSLGSQRVGHDWATNTSTNQKSFLLKSLPRTNMWTGETGL